MAPPKKEQATQEPDLVAELLALQDNHAALRTEIASQFQEIARVLDGLDGLIREMESKQTKPTATSGVQLVLQKWFDLIRTDTQVYQKCLSHAKIAQGMTNGPLTDLVEAIRQGEA